MRIKLTLLLFAFSFFAIQAQEKPEINPEYRAEYEKVNDLVHTKLKVDFNFAQRTMNGEAWITLKPHFYNVSELTLDAKAMIIKEVSLKNKTLKYDYDGEKLKIDLGTIFSRKDNYTVYIKYVAQPEKVTQEGSAAISDAKGLYFINHDGSEEGKPTQIWTQGETESSSCWFPTIDSPNQKSTQEIYMTVPSKYVTLSNGLLIEQTEHDNSTRTDYWKMDQKHAPYLFFMGVGEFSIVKDKWKDIAVDYYVEKEYEPFAKGIFGLTPEMIQFFSDFTGIEYMWAKYAQMVGRDYVSGAMENTTSVLHGEAAYQKAGDLIDENSFESTIAHELFHHWFGDYVTAESWSNLTVNESFANYSEYLWFEYKYGKDHADDHRHSDINGYLSGGNELKDLVRFYYNSREDMFDAVSYNKGGAILHMLRNYVGDEAFKASLKEYLSANQYGTGEAHQLRLAFEKITGKDMNWFFNQWYFNNGHPKLEVEYVYSEQAKIVTVKVKQTQDELFKFPLTIDVYESETPKSYKVWVKNKEETFSFKYTKKPLLVNADSDRVLLREWSDNKTVDNYVYLLKHGKKYEDRREAIENLAKNQSNDKAFQALVSALNDSYYGLRILTIDQLDIANKNAKKAISKIQKIATADPKTLVQAKAIAKLGLLSDKKYTNLFKNAWKSKSNAVKVSSLNALYKVDPVGAVDLANAIIDESKKSELKEALIPIYILDENEQEMSFVAKNLISGMFSEDKSQQEIYGKGYQWISGSNNEKATKNMVDSFVKIGLQYKSYGADKMMTQLLQNTLKMKQSSAYPNKEDLVKIVNEGLDKLK